MYTGSLAPVSNKEDWIAISPLVDDDGADVTLTGTTFEMFICREGCPNSSVLSGSTTDGRITFPTTTSFQWWFTADDMGALCAGTYDVFLRVTIAGVVTQIMSCTVPVLEGGPS
jgi:hypothetical protein